MTTIQGVGAKIVRAGILALLADDSGGKRTLGWLAKRSGISYSTLKNKLRTRPGSFTGDELFAIADAFGVDIRDIYAAGESALAAEAKAA
jgi:lambda repressor-like predicted transcriptional regulator